MKKEISKIYFSFFGMKNATAQQASLLFEVDK